MGTMTDMFAQLMGQPQPQMTPMPVQTAQPAPIMEGTFPREAVAPQAAPATSPDGFDTMLQPAAQAASTGQAPAQSSGGLFGDPNRLMLASMALMTPGSMAKKMQLMGMTQMAYTGMLDADARERNRQDLNDEALRKSRNAETEGQVLENTERKETAPERKRKLKVELETAEKNLKIAQREADAMDKLDPTGQKAAKLKLEKAEAEVQRIRAERDQASSAAGTNKAHADLYNRTDPASKGSKANDNRRKAAEALMLSGSTADQEYASKILRDIAQEEAASGGTPAADTTSKSAWEKARNSVKVGETYIGPDGKTYRRNK